MTLSADADPKWKASGAKAKKEHLEWTWNMCGMACFKMVLVHRNGKAVPLIELGKLCMKYGGYSQPFETSNGLGYKNFITFVKSEFDISARIAAPLLIRDIQVELARGNYVIISVSPAIRDITATPKSKGGHLVLVTGYDLDKKMTYLHNPSGFFGKSQKHAAVPFKDFNRFFAGRGIIIEK